MFSLFFSLPVNVFPSHIEHRRVFLFSLRMTLLGPRRPSGLRSVLCLNYDARGMILVPTGLLVNRMTLLLISLVPSIDFYFSLIYYRPAVFCLRWLD